MSLDQLQVRLGKIEIANPVMLASGVQGPSLSSALKALEYGAGAVVTKSIGLFPRGGFAEPNFVAFDAGYVNAIGLPNPGAESFSEEMRSLKGLNLPVFVSIFGGSAEEIERVAGFIEDNEFLGYEINLSCPHVRGVGTEIGHDPELVSSVVKRVKSKTSRPVFVKLSPNTERLVEVALAATDAGADGITAINTVKASIIDIEKGKPSLSNIYGGLSGPAIRPIALRCVYELREKVDVPIVGCGGISSWEHAVQFFLAGANAVQVGTATIGKLRIFNEINLGILSYLERKGYESVERIVGLAHRGIKTEREQTTSVFS